MGQCRRPLILLVWLLAILFLFGHCEGSRTTQQVFKIKPKSQFSGHFLGFLPRRIPIPASGPSRKHNDIGLQSWRSPWRKYDHTYASFGQKVTFFIYLYIFFLFSNFLEKKKEKKKRGKIWWWMYMELSKSNSFWVFGDNVFSFRSCINVHVLVSPFYDQGELVNWINIFIFLFWFAVFR